MSLISERKNVIAGFFLLLAFHLIAVILIVTIALYAEKFSSGNLAFSILYYGISWLFILQLIYVIPLCFLLSNQGKISMMSGVIIAAILTFLVNGGCFLLIMGGGNIR